MDQRAFEKKNLHPKSISYQDDNCDLEAFVAYPSEKKCPLVILCHASAKPTFEFTCVYPTHDLSVIKFLVENVSKSQNRLSDLISGLRHDRCFQEKTKDITAG